MPGSVAPTNSGNAPGPPPGAFAGVELAIVLPTLNEEEGLRRTYPELPIAALRALGWKVEPLIIDGGSRDRTLEVAAEYGLPVLHQRSRGKGAAIQEALSWLETEGVAYAVVLDADCTYPGAAISPMVALLEAGSDLVIGVRYPAAAGQGGPREAIHRWGNALLNLSASVLTRRPIIDLCSGLWGVRVSAAAELRLESQRFEVEAELFVKATRGGLTVNQIPIEYRQRVGEAKLRAVQDGAQIFLTLVRWAATPTRAPPRLAPRPGFVRSLLAVCFVHRADQVDVLVAPDRADDADRIVRSLRRGGVDPRVETGPAEAVDDPADGVELGSRPGVARAISVTLPRRAGDRSDTPVALVHIGYRGRLVVVGGRVGRVPAWLDRLQLRGYRLDGSDKAPDLLGPLQAAHASVTGRRPRQETAMLRANAYRSPVRIYVQDPARRAGPGAPTPQTRSSPPGDPEASP